MAEYFNSPHDYLQTASNLTEKIKIIDSIIDAMYQSLSNSALNSNIEEYQFNDGQTIVKAVNRDPKSIQAAIEALEKQRNYYQSKIEGRMMRLEDHRVKRC